MKKHAQGTYLSFIYPDISEKARADIEGRISDFLVNLNIEKVGKSSINTDVLEEQITFKFFTEKLFDDSSRIVFVEYALDYLPTMKNLMITDFY